MNMSQFTQLVNAQQDIHNAAEAFANMDDKKEKLIALFDGFAMETTTVSKKGKDPRICGRNASRICRVHSCFQLLIRYKKL
ncbi:hypothetical protein M5D96_010688 [Drosophila gunungcola]|uniref:Uncharacterized protein n=1 Tax=Drosophila gunungcola TaxID=103775 RepID=A0A9Q0BM59_9MUSC|nr:hypothetical protein M5D96_010688 [Drosophila gunungcola]